MMSIKKGILLCCWLGLAACSSEGPDGDEDAYEYEDDEYSDSAMEEPAEPPTARVMLDNTRRSGFGSRRGGTDPAGPNTG